MGWFRRRESLHERLAREGGLDSDRHVDVPIETRPPLEVGIMGIAQPRRWDVVAVTEAEGPPVDEVHFVALADRTLIVDEDVPDDSLAPLAEAVEEQLAPPYRAEGVRREEGVWAVAANQIEVLQMADEVNGDEVIFTSRGGERTLVVDGADVFGVLPALEKLGRERSGDNFAVEGRRIDGDLWEVRVNPL